MGVEGFTPAAYRAAFGSTGTNVLAEMSELIDARIARAAGNDPLDDLIGTTPQHVRAWMQRKAKLADGHQVGLPVCGRLALRRALDGNAAKHGAWMVEDGRNTWRGVELAWIGLLHDLCGLSWPEVANASDGSLSRTRRFGAAHRRLLKKDPGYARRAAEVGHHAITSCLG